MVLAEKTGHIHNLVLWYEFPCKKKNFPDMERVKTETHLGGALPPASHSRLTCDELLKDSFKLCGKKSLGDGSLILILLPSFFATISYLQWHRTAMSVSG
jgi:hypothetical protein